MGGAAMHMEITGVLPVVQLIREQGNGPAFAAIVSQLPLGKVLLPIMLVLLFIFLATTFNSAAFVLATVATPSHEDAAMGEREPAPWHSAFWACMMCVITGVLIYLGGLGPLQTAALVTSIPMTLMMIIVAYSGWKMMKNDEHLQLWQRGEEVQSAEGLPD
jgi:BCCT family betaine/carnitine transporter